MAYDIDMIRKVYSQIPERVKKLRALLDRPVTLTEKILYSHLSADFPTLPFEKGVSYVNFDPDRVAMQDATAQMALLQFMQAGKNVVSVPSTVHCDHLILARTVDGGRFNAVGREGLEIPRRHVHQPGQAGGGIL